MFQESKLKTSGIKLYIFSKAEKEKYFIKSYCKKKIGYLYRKMIVFFQVIIEKKFS